MEIAKVNKGIYILLIRLKRNRKILVGRLGKINFRSGLYLYVGSAQSNLKARIRRHLRQQKKIFWHIDYLLSQREAEVVKTWARAGRGECELANKFKKYFDVVKDFGSSDCRCQGHLFYLGK